MKEEIKIIHEKENPLFGRKEVIIKIKKESTPSYDEIRKIIFEKYSSGPEKIKIKRVMARFGSKEFTANVFLYNSEKDKNEIELMKKKDKIASSSEKKEEVKK